eukprot:16206640-Heterocapsa_arctica.AAC.1
MSEGRSGKARSSPVPVRLGRSSVRPVAAFCNCSDAHSPEGRPAFSLSQGMSKGSAFVTACASAATRPTL